MDLSQYKLFKDHEVFVIWNWIWVDQDCSSEVSVENNNEPERLQSSDSEEADTDAVPNITHSVVYKCIGQLKESQYQELLVIASKKIHKGEVVPVKSLTIFMMHRQLLSCAK